MIADLQKALGKSSPDKEFWLLFKVGAEEHIRALQRGTMYFNSVAYFSAIEGEVSTSLRGDPDEPILGRISGGSHGDRILKVTLSFEAASGPKAFDVSDNATFEIVVPDPDSVLVFCMCALADGSDGKIPGEVDGKLHLNPRLKEFGTHILLIQDAAELGRRISATVLGTPHLFSSQYFQGGFGKVKYQDATGSAQTLGLFTKRKGYEWQQEFRIVLGAHEKARNSRGAFELSIGDISDISSLHSLDALFEMPLSIARQKVRMPSHTSKVDPTN